MESQIENSRRFYEKQVAPMIHACFPEYEDRIAVGLCGEGSDCFGYDDFMSRDHDFGTGVCLWLTDEDMKRFGTALSHVYDELIDKLPGNTLTRRLRARRGVMTVTDFYSNILGIDRKTMLTILRKKEDPAGSLMTEENWRELDHACLATATNGEVFRDDPGVFSAFRKYLLNYYPDRVWKERLADELHAFSAALQVNYARCMSREDRVAAEQCRLHGMEAAMQLFFLLKRTYPPYYKWTYRRLVETDTDGRFATNVTALAEAVPDPSVWKGKMYSPKYLNLSDQVVLQSERIAEKILSMLREKDLVKGSDPYLENYVDEILSRL